MNISPVLQVLHWKVQTYIPREKKSQMCVCTSATFRNSRSEWLDGMMNRCRSSLSCLECGLVYLSEHLWDTGKVWGPHRGGFWNSRKMLQSVSLILILRKVWGPPRKVWGPPRKVWGPHRKVWGPPRKVWGPLRKVWGPPGSHWIGNEDMRGWRSLTSATFLPLSQPQPLPASMYLIVCGHNHNCTGHWMFSADYFISCLKA